MLTLSKRVMMAMAGATPELVARRSSNNLRSLARGRSRRGGWDETNTIRW